MRKVYTIVFLLLAYLSLIGQTVNDQILNNYVNASFEYSFFNEGLTDWYTGVFESRIENRRNLVFIPRITLSQRFDKKAIRIEQEVYKTLKNEDYLFVGVGISSISVFPYFNTGVEYFNPFGEGWEVSLGGRYLLLANNQNIGMLTGSLSKYYGKSLTILRPFIAFNNLDGSVNNLSLALQQRYYRNEREYFSLYGSYGYDPNIQLLSGNANFEIAKALNYTVGLITTHKLSETYRLEVRGEYNYFDFGVTQRKQYTLRCTIFKYW